MTSRYNGYFNADMLMQESILKLKAQHHDNYNKILDVYEYVDVENPQAVSADVDKAIKKATVNINLHRPSHWVDDEYLLIGEAQYLKHDYEAAENTLRFFAQEFNPSKRRGKSSKGSISAGLKNSTDKRVQQKAKELEQKEKERKNAEEKEIKEDIKKEKEKTREELNKEKQKIAKEKQKEREKKAKERKKLAKQKSKGKSSSKSKTPSKVIPAKPSPQDSIRQVQAKAGNKMTTISPKDTSNIAAKEEVDPEKAFTPDNYFLKHRPAFQPGLVWLSRTLIERKKYTESVYLLKNIQENPKAFKDVRREAAVAEAHAYARQGDYNAMIEPLEKAIALTKKKITKARYAFIIAQIHQENGRYADATRYYEKAINFKPVYDMRFRAELNLVLTGMQSGKESAENAEKRLNKMLKDDKNKEYLDQVHYILAMMQLKNGNQVAAIDELKKAASTASTNTSQKAETYYQLATINFDIEDFVAAKSYYDSTLQVMPKTDPRFAESNRYSKNLLEIALNLQIVSLQDSLLRIADMDEPAKKALAKQLKKEKQSKIEAMEATKGAPPKAANTLPAFANQLNPVATASSSFFAYDDKVVKRGKKDFDDLWGNRQLEDNWRWSKRANANSGLNQETVAMDSLVEDPDDISSLDMNTLLKDVPKNQAEVAAANSKIMNALFKLGQLYRDKLQDNKNAIKSLETLLERYPTTVFDEETYYLLYLCYSEAPNMERANYYKDKLLQKNPNSKFSLAIVDPNYLKKMSQKEDPLEDYYQLTYQYYTESKYDTVFARSQEAGNIYGKSNRLQPKFALLSAMSVGNLEGRDQYIAALQDVVAKYPTTKEETRAKEILRLLGQVTSSPKDTVITNKPKVIGNSAYVLDEKINHFIIVIITGKDLTLNDAKVAMSDYNRKFHSLDDLKITNITLDATTNTNVIIVRKFDDKAAAMKYYEEVQRNQRDFVPDPSQYEMFAISQDNYKNLLKARSHLSYRDFFIENYLQ